MKDNRTKALKANRETMKKTNNARCVYPKLVRASSTDQKEVDCSGESATRVSKAGASSLLLLLLLPLMQVVASTSSIKFHRVFLIVHM